MNPHTEILYKPGIQMKLHDVAKLTKAWKIQPQQQDWQGNAQILSDLTDAENRMKTLADWNLNQRLKPGDIVLNPNLSFTDHYEVLPMHPTLNCNWLQHITTGDHCVAAPDDSYFIIGRMVQKGGSDA